MIEEVPAALDSSGAEAIFYPAVIYFGQPRHLKRLA